MKERQRNGEKREKDIEERGQTKKEKKMDRGKSDGTRGGKLTEKEKRGGKEEEIT